MIQTNLLNHFLFSMFIFHKPHLVAAETFQTAMTEHAISQPHIALHLGNLQQRNSVLDFFFLPKFTTSNENDGSDRKKKTVHYISGKVKLC